MFTPKKVCFETFGCRLNRAEALDDEARAIAAGYTVVTGHADADVIVVRGCSVTRRAQRDTEKLIDHIRGKYPDKTVVVTGCLEGAKKFEPKEKVPAKVPMRTARAYLKVQDGCSGTCTFCIVPRFRGASVSTAFADVLDRAKRFIAAGYREIVVTGCNLTLYANAGRRLPDLVAALAALDPDVRIRLGSVEPGAVARETVAAMAATPNVCRMLHIPFQSGSDAVLARMRRPYLADDVAALAHEARRLMPAIGLGCDVMTGFPGESETDFTATKALIETLAFSNAHVFPYSERPGTPAASFTGVLARDVRHARARAVADLATAARRAFAQSFVGKIVEIVCETENDVAGWTGEYLRAEAQTPFRLGNLRRRLVRLSVTGVKGDTLLGEVLNHGR